MIRTRSCTVAGLCIRYDRCFERNECIPPNQELFEHYLHLCSTILMTYDCCERLLDISGAIAGDR